MLVTLAFMRCEWPSRAYNGMVNFADSRPFCAQLKRGEGQFSPPH